MSEEIKEILNIINYKYKDYYVQDIVSGDDLKLLSDYITNLQYKYENQIHRYMNLKEQTTKLQQENERLRTELNSYKDEFCKDTIKEYELVMEQEYYKSRCENAVEFTKKESKKCYSNQTTDDPQKVIGNFMWHTDKLLNILNGGDKE